MANGEQDMILVLQPDRAEADLLAGRLTCSCTGRLRPWAHARARLVRQRDGSWVELRPRRARCAQCGRSHVVSPASSLPRRRDMVETVGAALEAAAAGKGHRYIADELDLPPSTVRNWLRRARARAEWSRCTATRAAYELDPALPPAPVRPTPLASALDALGAVAAAAVRRLGLVGTSPWAIIAAVTGGQFLAALPGG